MIQTKNEFNFRYIPNFKVALRRRKLGIGEERSRKHVLKENTVRTLSTLNLYIPGEQESNTSFCNVVIFDTFISKLPNLDYSQFTCCFHHEQMFDFLATITVKCRLQNFFLCKQLKNFPPYHQHHE